MVFLCAGAVDEVFAAGCGAMSAGGVLLRAPGSLRATCAPLGNLPGNAPSMRHRALAATTSAQDPADKA